MSAPAKVPSLLEIAQARQAEWARAQGEEVRALVDLREEQKNERNRKRWAEAKREERAKKRAEREAANPPPPPPYAALGGRQQIARKRVATEARARQKALEAAKEKHGGSQRLIQLDEPANIVAVWVQQQFLRIDTFCEPTYQQIGDAMQFLAGKSKSERRRTAWRILQRVTELEASGVWKPFDLLASGNAP